MDKFTFKTADGVDVNLEKLSRAFPEVITETMGEDGKIKHVADFEKLKMLLGDSAAERPQEFYEFTWPGKNEAIFEVAKATTKTLRPCPEESKNWDTTQNLYIEGDNLEALKILQESYLGKVKMIYIDPPYNTGKDFVYRDNFQKSAEEGKADETVRDEETDNNLFQNTESNGRFHSDWCSMIYPRLKLARDLLSDDGVIFISIDDNEVTNLKKICDEIFGAENLCGIISRLMKSGGAKGRFFSPNIEYIIVYGKNIDLLPNFREPLSDEIINKLYTSIEHSGERKGERYRPFGLYQSSLDSRSNQRYYIECPDGELVIPPGTTMPQNKKDGEMIFPNSEDGCWRWSKERYVEERKKGNIAFKRSNGILINSDGRPAKWNIYSKIWLSDRENDGMVPVNLITKWENRQSTKELQELAIPFDFAKPVGLIKYLINTYSASKYAIILDFFSGSATTAHACMQLNAEDGGNRKFIMVQLPEVCAPDSESAKAGYKNICEIGKERIRRAGEKIKAEHATTAPNLDIGFRVLKIDESIMKDVFYSPNETSQDLLSTLESNIKEDRTDLDLLFACLVDWGVELSMPLRTESIDGVEIHTMSDGDTPALIACFAQNIPETVVRKIAARHPIRAVFRDSSFADSPSKINVTEIFKTYSPETDIKVL